MQVLEIPVIEFNIRSSNTNPSYTIKAIETMLKANASNICRYWKSQ